MSISKAAFIGTFAMLAYGAAERAAAATDQPAAVTVGNFIRAETDTYFSGTANAGGFGKLQHRRALAPIDKQDVVRMNRDTLYSSGVFDLDAGPLTIMLPDAGTRYVYVIVRTLVDPRTPGDIKVVNKLQDGIGVKQPAAGKFEVPHWDPVSQAKVRDALSALGSLRGKDKGQMFGTKDKVDPVVHLIGTATGWGGNPPEAAVYKAVYPEANDGRTVHRLKVKDVPVDGFWSISVYNDKGFFEKNNFDAYSLNSLTATKDAEGAITVQFGDCEKTMPNCLPIMKGWNYTVRLYRPRADILSGSWSFPQAKPAK